MDFNLIATATFGLEALVAKELKVLGYEDLETENGRVKFSGDEMDVAIAIRTGVIKDGMLYVQAAAGIVADSDPEKEWQETEAKARAVIRAAEKVQFGLDEPV